MNKTRITMQISLDLTVLARLWKLRRICVYLQLLLLDHALLAGILLQRSLPLGALAPSHTLGPFLVPSDSLWRLVHITLSGGSLPYCPRTLLRIVCLTHPSSLFQSGWDCSRTCPLVLLLLELIVARKLSKSSL